jgi:hypothetical protein
MYLSDARRGAPPSFGTIGYATKTKGKMGLANFFRRL